MQEYSFIISEEYEGERADRILAMLMPDCSRTYLQKLIKNGDALINGKAFKPSLSLCSDDNLLLKLPEPVLPDIAPENIPIDIVYENNDYMIINKARGMVVHPAPGHFSGTLVNAVMYHTKDLSGINGVLRPGIVHRIDKDTTGLLIICKNDESHRMIAAQLKEHSIERKYEALVHGNFKESSGTIDKALGRSPSDRMKYACIPSGKRAVTHYEVLEQFDGYAHIACKLETGRTHQIRVHMASIGHPLVGDPVYGIKEKNFTNVNGQVLHAKTLGFKEPGSGKDVFFDSKLPEYFTELLERLKGRSKQK